MGWNYLNRIAYGIHVNGWQSPALKSLLKKYEDNVAFNREMAIGGHEIVFVYIKSTYKVLAEDHGSYTNGRPDIEGTAFSPAKHLCLHEEDREEEDPILSEKEIMILEEIKRQCICRDDDDTAVWIHHATIT